MSGDYVPLHWQPDLGGAQADENLARLAYFQRTREQRLGKARAIPEEDPDADDGSDKQEEPDPPTGSIRGHGCAR